MPHDFTIEIDSNGSPVAVPAAEWFVCFVPGLRKQWWHRFTNTRHQHVFAMRMVADDSWIIVEPWWTRMLVSVLTLDEAVKFLRWGASGDILQVREAVPGCGNQLRGWSNCAVLIAFLLGRSYSTWSPHGLYRRLLAERDTRQIDLPLWLASHVYTSAARADHALEAPDVYTGHSLRTALLDLGKGIANASLSRSALGLYKFAASESSRFGAAADAYRQCATQGAVERIRKVLQHAQLRGEIEINDPAAVARQFVAMLRGDIYLEMLFSSGSRPDATDIHVHVESAVELLLHGALAADASTQRCIDVSQSEAA